MADFIDASGALGIKRRMKEVRPGEFAPEVSVVGAPTAPFANLFEDANIVAISGSVTSGWLDLETLGVTDLLIRRRAAGGAYQFEIDWSRDGVGTNPITEIINVPDSGSVVKQVVARFARVRVRNTSAVAAFTSHYTGVEGR